MARNIKVLMIGPSRGSQGGIASVVNGFFEAGLDKTCDLTYLNCVCMGGKAKKLAQGIRSLAWTLGHARAYDIAHVHMGGGNSFYREQFFVDACIKRGVPTILHLHDGLFKTFWENRADERTRQKVKKTFESVSALIVLSSDMKKYIKNNVSDSVNIMAIPNGIKLPDLPYKPKENGTILFLGHFDDNKNADILIKAMVEVKQRCGIAKAYFGADGDVGQFNKNVNELNLQDTCSYLGWVNTKEKQEILNRCSIYCLPSKNEAMPIGLLEAMANEIAAVVTPVGGMIDIIEDGITGIFVPVNDVHNLANALCRLIESRELREKIAMAGRKKIESDYALDKIVSKHLALYHSLTLENTTKKV